MINVERYVKDQISVFQANEVLEKRLENLQRRPGRGQVAGLSYGPYLTISREKGAGGNAVARLVGNRLGWRVFDNEIVDEIAKQAQVRRQLVESLDERDQKTIQDLVGQLVNSKAIGTAEYLGYLKQVVLTLGHQGDVIIVGRGARFILPGQFGLGVRMVAPLEVRIRRIAEQGQLSLAAAQAEIEKTDHARVRSMRRQFGRDVRDPLNHDLILNTAALSLEAAADVVIMALERNLGVQSKTSCMNNGPICR